MRFKHLLATFSYFIFIDALWIIFAAAPLYHSELGGMKALSPDFMIVAAFIYSLMFTGLYYFVLQGLANKESILSVVLRSILYGMCVYGVYTFTNFLIIKKWSLLLVITDIGWGIFLNLTTACVAIWLRKFDS